jgi:hypothetical protein
MSQAELERSILEARDRGDTGTLERLQAEYRRTAGVTRINREPIRLVERAQSRDFSPQSDEGQGSPPVVSVPLAIRITAEAHRELSQLPLWNEEHREVGGWCFGYTTPTEVVICAIRGAAYDTGVTGERNGMTMSGEYAADWEDRLGIEAIGMIHSHPDTDPDEPLRLSSNDEDAALEAARVWRRSFATILLGENSPDLHGAGFEWVKPRLAGWLAHSDRSVRSCPIILEPEAH